MSWKINREWIHRHIQTGWSFIDGESFNYFQWNFSQTFKFFRGIHPSQYPPLYSHPGLPGALERERLGLPPGPQHLDPNEQMVSFSLFINFNRPKHHNWNQRLNCFWLWCWLSLLSSPLTVSVSAIYFDFLFIQLKKKN